MTAFKKNVEEMFSGLITIGIARTGGIFPISQEFLNELQKLGLHIHGIFYNRKSFHQLFMVNQSAV